MTLERIAPRFGLPPGGEPVWYTCKTCAGNFTALRNGACLDCSFKAEAAWKAEDDLRRRVANIESTLGKIGLSKRERASSMEQITPAVATHIPPTFGRQGFGLSGIAGVGKTGALAALVREFALSHTIRHDQVISWLSWPETVNRFRVMSMQKDGQEDVSEEVQRAIGCSILILDDLGAERIKGSYLDDWAASQLDLIVDGRYRNCSPTWYTTGLFEAKLVDLYGPRLYSRLCGPNPLIELPALDDRRHNESQ